MELASKVRYFDIRALARGRENVAEWGAELDDGPAAAAEPPWGRQGVGRLDSGV